MGADMTTQSGSLPERVARIEGVLEHLATKADIERLKFTLVSLQLAGLAIILAAIRLWM